MADRAVKLAGRFSGILGYLCTSVVQCCLVRALVGFSLPQTLYGTAMLTGYGSTEVPDIDCFLDKCLMSEVRRCYMKLEGLSRDSVSELLCSCRSFVARYHSSLDTQGSDAGQSRVLLRLTWIPDRSETTHEAHHASARVHGKVVPVPVIVARHFAKDPLAPFVGLEAYGL